MRDTDSIYIPFDRNGNSYNRKNRMPLVFEDEYHAKSKGFDPDCLVEYAPVRHEYWIDRDDKTWCSGCGKDPVAILNQFRNRYYADGGSTENGIVANAINDILPRMILPPCKVGNTVYSPRENDILEQTVVSIEIEEGPHVRVYFTCDHLCDGCPNNQLYQNQAGDGGCFG